MTLHYNEVHKCLVLVYSLDANTPMHCVYVTMYVEFRKLLIISQQVFRQCHTNKKLIQNTPITTIGNRIKSMSVISNGIHYKVATVSVIHCEA